MKEKEKTNKKGVVRHRIDYAFVLFRLEIAAIFFIFLRERENKKVGRVHTGHSAHR